MAISFFNLHSHYSAKKVNETAICSFTVADASEINDDIEFFSIGLHPWFINSSTLETDLETIANLAKKPNCVAIGECGLDRLKGPDLEIQANVFARQLEIANFAGKPVVIHCVRAFPELLAVKKEFKTTTPWIIHGFSGKPATAQQLLQHDIYISFGVRMLESDQLKKTVKAIPIDRLFLETDESELPMKELYQLAAKLKNVSVPILQNQLQHNAKTLNLI